MRDKLLLAVLVSGLALSPAGATGGEDKAAVDRYGCGQPVAGSGEEVVPAKRLRAARMLSYRELKRWAPIEASGMIGCDGKVHDLKIEQELPPKIEGRLRNRVGKLRWQPATLAGRPVAVKYSLVLDRPQS